MFEVGFFMLLKNLLINILVPLLTGILFTWIIFDKKFKGILLYIISFFLGVGVISASLFNIQFIYFGVGIFEYILINILLIIIFTIKLQYSKQNLKGYFKTLKLSISFSNYKNSFLELKTNKKIITVLSLIFISWFTIIAFIFNANFPTYGDDSFNNWNQPAINIYNDGGIKLFGEKEEILGQGRLGYPIYIPSYKALISDFNGEFNDIYINLLQFLSFLFFIIFIFIITFKKTKNLFKSTFPLVLIMGLPLVFFHAIEGYMELLSAIYSVLTLYYIYKYLEKDDHEYLLLGLLFGFILINIKNEGLIVYLSGILFALGTLLILKKELFVFLKKLKKNKNFIYKIIGFFSFLSLPFILLKQYHSLSFNPTASDDGFIIHWEIFDYFSPIFFAEDNYNISLVLLFIISYIVYKLYTKKSKISNLIFPYISFVYIFVIFTLVFLLTENYQWMVNQTTVNRVFTMSFIILFSFSGLLLDEKTH